MSEDKFKRIKYVGFEELCSFIDTPQDVLGELKELNHHVTNLHGAITQKNVELLPNAAFGRVTEILTSVTRICKLLELNGTGISQNVFNEYNKRAGSRLDKI